MSRASTAAGLRSSAHEFVPFARPPPLPLEIQPEWAGPQPFFAAEHNCLPLPVDVALSPRFPRVLFVACTGDLARGARNLIAALDLDSGELWNVFDMLSPITGMCAGADGALLVAAGQQLVNLPYTPPPGGDDPTRAMPQGAWGRPHIDFLGGERHRRQYVDAEGRESRFMSPMGLALAPDGRRVYVCEHSAWALRAFSFDTRSTATLAGPRPEILDPAGRWRFDIGGAAPVVSRLAGADAGSARAALLRFPQCAAVTSDSAFVLVGCMRGLAVVDASSGAVRCLGEQSLSVRGAVRADTHASFFVSITSENKLGLVDLVSGEISELAGSGLWASVDGASDDSAVGFAQPCGLAFDGGALFVAEESECVVRAVDDPRLWRRYSFALHQTFPLRMRLRVRTLLLLRARGAQSAAPPLLAALACIPRYLFERLCGALWA